MYVYLLFVIAAFAAASHSEESDSKESPSRRFPNYPERRREPMIPPYENYPTSRGYPYGRDGQEGRELPPYGGGQMGEGIPPFWYDPFNRNFPPYGYDSMSGSSSDENRKYPSYNIGKQRNGRGSPEGFGWNYGYGKE